MSVSAIDLEIIRHRLETINADAGETLVRVSGSQIASEAGDYNTALMTADGAVVACSKSVVVQSTSLNLVVADILARYRDNPGISEGDQFLTNDPYIGALHQPDVTIVAPIFADGRLIAWAGCTVHEADVGGPVGGGFNQAARSIFDEPLPIAPIKLVEGGRIRADIERDILARSRTPELNALDLLGQVAANQAAGTRLLELVERYGVDNVTAAMDQLLDTTEAAFRRRLRALPDGRWRDIAYLQHERRIGDVYLPNQIYAVRLTLTKIGDRLILDFSESDAQAPGAINSAYPALANFAMASLLVHLCQGMPWVPGAIWRAIDLKSRPGTIVHAEWPAGVAMSTGTSAQSIRNVTSACIARLLDGSEEYAPFAMASSQSTGAGGMSISGLDAAGRPFHTLFLDELTGGSGASGLRDGADVAGTATSPGATPSNVETNEAAFPILYLMRGELADSAGPGRQRGGSGAIWSYRPHGAQGEIALNSMAQGLQHPSTLGIIGGEPGSASGIAVAPGAPAGWEPVIAGAVGSVLSLPGAGLGVRAGGAMIASSQGGGGLGDPIERDTAAVLDDVEEGLVSAEGALRDYAVVISEDGVDEARTRAARLERRRERLAGREPVARNGTRAGRRLSTHLDVEKGKVVCAGCRSAICREGEPIVAALLCREASAGERFALTALYPGHERFRVRHFYCPGCAAQIDVQVAIAGEPPIETIAALPAEEVLSG
jgi:N-methylhydantoinase B